MCHNLPEWRGWVNMVSTSIAHVLFHCRNQSQDCILLMPRDSKNPSSSVVIPLKMDASLFDLLSWPSGLGLISAGHWPWLSGSGRVSLGSGDSRSRPSDMDYEKPAIMSGALKPALLEPQRIVPPWFFPSAEGLHLSPGAWETIYIQALIPGNFQVNLSMFNQVCKTCSRCLCHWKKYHHFFTQVTSNNSPILLQIHRVWSKCYTGGTLSLPDGLDQQVEFDVCSPSDVSEDQKTHRLCSWRETFVNGSSVMRFPMTFRYNKLLLKKSEKNTWVIFLAIHFLSNIRGVSHPRLSLLA